MVSPMNCGKLWLGAGGGEFLAFGFSVFHGAIANASQICSTVSKSDAAPSASSARDTVDWETPAFSPSLAWLQSLVRRASLILLAKIAFSLIPEGWPKYLSIWGLKVLLFPSLYG